MDQDQQVFAPAPTTRFSATVSNASGCTIDWIKISVDGGSSMPATIPTGSSTGYINWNSSSAGNPSEHTVTATAQIHDSVGTVSLDSTRPEGNGRPADDIIADMRLKSIQFTGNIGLTQNATTPVSTPELTWDPATGNSKSSSPAAYVQGKTVGFTMTLCDSKGAALAGSATAGYTLKLQANPNATNAATGQPAPPLTLYDNTTASPVAPTAISGSTATVKATAALNSYVARYTTTLSPINFYVKFTHVTPTPTWRSVSSPSPSGNTLYAVVATPTAPMATPWVPVLDYACQWATGATDATSATTALTNSEFNKCTYDDRTVYTDLSTDPNKNGIPQDGQEVFSLQHFLNNTLNKRNQLTGDCRTLADFLCCLSNSIGATPLQVQRSASVSDILNNSDRHCFFTTNYGFQAPPVQGVYAQTVAWVYHQWATSNVYDGAFEVSASNTATVYPTGVIPLANKSLNDYKSALVNTAISPCFWRPQTAFAPSIVN